MTTLKSIAFFLSATLLSAPGFAQTTTKTTTTVVKTTTTAVKTAASATKVPQTITPKTTAKKATTTKSLQKKPATKTTTTTKTPTPSTPSKTQIGEPVQVKTITPVIQKTEPGLVIPKPQFQNTPPQAPVSTKIQTGTNTQTNTNTTPSPSTGGKIITGGGDNSQQQQTNGGKVIIGGGTDNGNNNSIINTITDGDATSAIKEALMKGIQVGVDKVSVTDGYLGNSLIKIPFPSQVSQVESALRNFGMGSLVDNAVTAINRAAESAASQAGPIFINSIKQMNVTDAVNIVSNKQPDAATQFLQRTTTESLVSSFKPSIKTALDKTMATKYWGDITGYYNKIPFVNPINTDLPDYVTRKAIDGLFVMVAQEEAKIRKDPGGQANEIIKTVFGKVKF